MIPKVIHCFWAGGLKTKLAETCLASWRKYAPDWEIREWSLKEVMTLNPPPFFSEAIAARKWAFASDWARFAIIAAEGGVYFDTDVELIRPIDDLLGESFFACEKDHPRMINPGLGFAAEKGAPVLMAILERYATMTFDRACHQAQAIPCVVTDIVQRFPEIKVYPARVFNPKGGCAGKVVVTPETRAIHHFVASWFNWKQTLAYKVLPRIGINITPLVKWLRRP